MFSLVRSQLLGSWLTFAMNVIVFSDQEAQPVEADTWRDLALGNQ